jgi:N-acetylglutamate synthase-like GNAT family acetyltransferase
MYSTWIEKSLSGELAEAVLVERMHGKVVGVITLSCTGGVGQIGLFAVDHEWRARGIGGRLLTAARVQARGCGCSSLIVVTQGTNALACRRYESAGFALHGAQDIFHFWS